MTGFQANKFTLILLVLFYFGKGKARLAPAPPLAGTSWMSSAIFGSKETGSYRIFPAGRGNPYGNYLRFTDSTHFVSGNIGPCGNECRAVVHGRYYAAGNEACIYTDSIAYWKECAHRPTERISVFAGAFTISNAGDALIFKKKQH